MWLLLVIALAGLSRAVMAQIGTSAGPATTRVPVEGGGTYAEVSPAELASVLKRTPILLINVHTPYEGEINGTRLFIPFDRIEANLNRLPADKRERIVLYCRSGHMSAIAAQALVKRGYTDVWNLAGGMIAWEQAGFPLRHTPR
jgi:rhodanese-related sulfurtransferase